MVRAPNEINMINKFKSEIFLGTHLSLAPYHFLKGYPGLFAASNTDWSNFCIAKYPIL